MKKTILTTAILFALLSCSKDDNNTGGSGSRCLNYGKMWNEAQKDRGDKIQRQNEIQAGIKKPYRYDSTKYTQGAKDSILISNKIIDSAKMQFTIDSARIYGEVYANGCEAYFNF